MENRTLYGIEDGLAVNEDVGSWSPEKYRILQLYAHLFTKGMKGKWKGLTFVDLYSGAGHSRMKGSDEILLGSPLIALALDVLFDKYVFVESDAEKIEALKSRVTRAHPTAAVTYIHGDCRDKITEVIEAIPTGSLVLCFVDPYDIAIDFRMIEQLATARKVDFICLLATRTDVGRNPHNYLKAESTKIDVLMGSTEWRTNWDRFKETQAKEPNLGDFIREEFARRMQTLGYQPTASHEMKPIKTDNNVTLYHLSLFTKSDVAKKYWQETKNYSQPQRNLFNR